MIFSLRWVPALILMFGRAFPLLAQVLERPPTDRSPTIVPSAPAWLQVAASVPTRLDLRWAAAANAGLYDIMRSSTSEPERLLLEIPATTGDQDLAGKYYYYFDNLPPRSGGMTFTYTVYAVSLGANGSRSLSAPSPSFSIRALTPLAPPNLQSRVVLSPIMGRLRVALGWGPVNMATGYSVFQIPRPGITPLPMLATTVSQPPLIIDNVVPGQGGTLCVVTVYGGLLKDETVRSCDLVVTRAP